MPNSIVVFGAGQSGREFLLKTDEKVVAFIDNDKGKHGSYLDNIPVYNPEALTTLEFDRIVVASVYEPEIKKQLIRLGFKHKISTPGFSPVNLNNIDVTTKRIDKDASYALQVAKGYINNLGGKPEIIINKAILELGPGINLGTALIFLGWGAREVTISDRFPVRFTPEYHIHLYKRLIGLLKDNHTDVNVTPIQDCLLANSHDIEKLETVGCSLEELSAFCPEKFDITLSNAVFEHLYNPLEAFKSLHHCMAPKSVGSHQVDFRDHRDFDHPLEFLLLDELSFTEMMNDACCEFGNRVRPIQMQAMFELAGFTNVVFSSNMQSTPEYLDHLITRLTKSKISPFRRSTAEELIDISGNFTFQKRE